MRRRYWGNMSYVKGLSVIKARGWIGFEDFACLSQIPIEIPLFSKSLIPVLQTVDASDSLGYQMYGFNLAGDTLPLF